MERFVWRYRDVEKMLAGGPLPPWLVYGLFLLAAVNLVVFFFATFHLGGDALSGHEAGGRYFLSYKGKLTEVSREVYRFSLWHTLSVFVTHALAMVTGPVCYRMAKKARGAA